MSQTAPRALRALATSFGSASWARQGARLAPVPMTERSFSTEDVSDPASRRISYTNRKLATDLAQRHEYLTHAKARELVDETIELVISALKRGEGFGCIM